MTQPRPVKTFKDTNYFAQGTYKREYRDYINEIGFINIVTRTILAPIQRWRIIRQTQLAYPLRPLKFKNFTDYVSRIPKQQGFSAFWRGNMAGLWLYFTQSFIQIGFHDNLKRLMKDLYLQEQSGSLFTLASERIVMPLIATFFTQIITLPIDTARVRISMNFVKEKSKFPFKGIRTCLRQIRSEQNFAAMYKGFFLSNMIALINFNFYLTFSDLLSKVVIEDDYTKFVNIDTIAAVSSLALLHPLDTLKKIVQLDNLSSPSIIKNGRAALQYVKREGGYMSLYNGFSVSIIKSFLFLPTFYLARQGFEQIDKNTKHLF